MAAEKETYSSLWGRLVQLLKLYVTSARLSLAEKLTRVLTLIAIGAVSVLLAIIAFFFISIAIVHWISDGVGLPWAYLIMGGAYLLILLILALFRTTLIINPLARAISRILL